MKAAVVDTGRSERLRAELKRSRAPTLDCPDQVQVYLNRLAALVPTAPKHRRLTKLEVIQCVIDYICDLEDTLLSRHQSAEEPATGGQLQRGMSADQHSTSADQHSTSADQHSTSADQRSTSADQRSTVRASQPPPPPAAGL